MKKPKSKSIYKPPKPTDPDDVIILEHQPPIVFKIKMFGESVEIRISRCRFRKMGASRSFRRVSARLVSGVCVSVCAHATP
jgi:hypothetical protein